jgi:uncharacterized protein
VKIERDGRAEGPVISGIVGRGFRVDDGVYEGLLISPSRADAWSPPPIEALGADDVAPLLAEAPLPEFILLGTGSRLVRPPQSFIAALEAKGVGVEVMDSRAAARAWGVLRAELRAIAGALYPLD